MRRLAGLLLLLCMIGIRIVPIMAMEGSNGNTENKVESEQSYVAIENCDVDCKSGNVENLTKYLSEHLDLAGYTVGFEKIIPADREGEKYWILYSINFDSKKTPYSVWAYSDKNSLKYNSKWNKKKLDDLSRNEKSFLSSDLELEEAKKVAYVPFNESTLDMQKITIETDSDLRPYFSILTAYRDIESTSFFALEMQYIYDNDIVPEKNESWSPFLSVEETLKLDLKNSDYNSIEKYLGERIEGFKDAGFKVETIIPANANYYYIDSFVDGILKMYFYRLEQKSHMVFGFKYNDIQTPYKVEVVMNKNKMEYRYNFSPEDINALLNNDFIKNTTIPEEEIQKAVEKCENVAKEKFNDNKYEIVSQELIKGLDEELRFYVDVKIIYKNIRYKNDDKLAVSSRYYVSL